MLLTPRGCPGGHQSHPGAPCQATVGSQPLQRDTCIYQPPQNLLLSCFSFSSQVLIQPLDHLRVGADEHCQNLPDATSCRWVHLTEAPGTHCPGHHIPQHLSGLRMVSHGPGCPSLPIPISSQPKAQLCSQHNPTGFHTSYRSPQTRTSPVGCSHHTGRSYLKHPPPAE